MNNKEKQKIIEETIKDNPIFKDKELVKEIHTLNEEIKKANIIITQRGVFGSGNVNLGAIIIRNSIVNLGALRLNEEKNKYYNKIAEEVLKKLDIIKENELNKIKYKEEPKTDKEFINNIIYNFENNIYILREDSIIQEKKASKVETMVTFMVIEKSMRKKYKIDIPEDKMDDILLAMLLEKHQNKKGE